MEQDSDASRSELDEFAVRMRTAVERFIGNPDADRGFVEMTFATDGTVGDYPQAALDQSRVYLEDDGGLYHDRFPRSVHGPVRLKLRAKAKWTDVLSSDLWSEGLLLSDRALAVVAAFDLGNAMQYPAEVSRRTDKRAFTYLFPANHVTHADVDFKGSEFYIADMIGTPQRLIDVTSAADFDRTRERIVRGELDGVKPFSRLQFKKMRLKPKRVPRAAVFGLGTFGTAMYVRRELCDALRLAAVTGLEFKRNNMLYVG